MTAKNDSNSENKNPSIDRQLKRQSNFLRSKSGEVKGGLNNLLENIWPDDTDESQSRMVQKCIKSNTAATLTLEIGIPYKLAERVGIGSGDGVELMIFCYQVDIYFAHGWKK